MGIIEDPHTYLYYQNEFPEREPLILFGGCQFENIDETTKELIQDLKKLFQSILDSIEQAYLIYFNVTDVVKGISGELSVRMSNLRQNLQEKAHDYHALYGKDRLLRLQMMTQLYRQKQVNAILLTSKMSPPFELFFIHWLGSILNDFFIIDLINAIALNVLTRLGLATHAHGILAGLIAELSIYVRNENISYTI
ncbi:MAG: hypothetical protein ACTSPV_07415 [Candidatus Hodarchaeales archaeon]